MSSEPRAPHVLESLAEYLVREQKLDALRELGRLDPALRPVVCGALHRALEIGGRVICQWLAVSDLEDGDQQQQRSGRKAAARVDEYRVCSKMGQGRVMLCGPGQRASLYNVRLDWLLARTLYHRPMAGSDFFVEGPGTGPGMLSINRNTVPLDLPDDLTLWRVCKSGEAGVLLEQLLSEEDEDHELLPQHLFLPTQLHKFCLKYAFDDGSDAQHQQQKLPVPRSGLWTQAYHRHSQLMWQSIFGPGLMVKCEGNNKNATASFDRMVVVAGNQLPTGTGSERAQVNQWLHDAWCRRCGKQKAYPLADCEVMGAVRSLRGHGMLCAMPDDPGSLAACRNNALAITLGSQLMSSCLEVWEGIRRASSSSSCSDMWPLLARGHTQLDLMFVIRHRLEAEGDGAADATPETTRFLVWCADPQWSYSLFFVRYYLANWGMWYVEPLAHIGGPVAILDLASAANVQGFLQKQAAQNAADQREPWRKPSCLEQRGLGRGMGFLMPCREIFENQKQRGEGARFFPFTGFSPLQEHVETSYDQAFSHARGLLMKRSLLRPLTPDRVMQASPQYSY